MPLPRCFFDVSINGISSGRIVFELFRDDTPRTVENFRCLCTGEKGEGRTTFKPLHYEGSPIHRIVKGFIIQGGDFGSGDGTGGESIYGGMFKDEVFKHKHDQPFLLSMANKGPHTNGSQFFITTRPAPHLDGIHVIFGRVIDGFQFVTEMENQKVDTSHRPYADVRITHSGELVLLKKSKIKKPAEVLSSSASSEVSSSDSNSESDSEESTDSEEEKRRRRRKRKKRRKKKELLKKKEVSKEDRRKIRRSLKAKKLKKPKTSKKKKRKPEPKEQMEKHLESADGSSGSGSEMSHLNSSMTRSNGQSEEDEPVTSTVPELTGDREEVLAIFKSDRSSWLFRRSRSRSPKEEVERKKGRVVTTRQQAPGYKPSLVTRKNEVSQSGRKLKGRGQMRYRTPPRYGDGDDLRFELQSTRPFFGSDRRERKSEHQRRSRSRSQDRLRRRFNNSPPRYRSRREYGRGRDWGDTRGKMFEERPRRWDSPPGTGTQDQQDRGQNRKGKSRSPESKRRDHRRQRSVSVSPSRRHTRRSRFDQQDSGDGGRRRDRGSVGEGEILQSKWARHHDQAGGNVSTSEDEDHQLEMTYQEKDRKLVEEQDVFGLDKIL